MIIKKQNIIEKDVESSNSNNFVENPVENFVVGNDMFCFNSSFSFANLARLIPAFKKYTDLFPTVVIERAERTLCQKREGQKLTMKQILMWIEQENTFYQQNHRGE